jgi:hypothetical protein
MFAGRRGREAPGGARLAEAGGRGTGGNGPPRRVAGGRRGCWFIGRADGVVGCGPARCSFSQIHAWLRVCCCVRESISRWLKGLSGLGCASGQPLKYRLIYFSTPQAMAHVAWGSATPLVLPVHPLLQGSTLCRKTYMSWSKLRASYRNWSTTIFVQLFSSGRKSSTLRYRRYLATGKELN